MLKKSRSSYENRLGKAKNELEEKEKKIQESTHTFIKDLNKAEIERNRLIQETSIVEPVFVDELTYKVQHEEKAKALQAHFQSTVELLMAYDKVIQKRLESTYFSLTIIVQKERVKIDELKIIESEKPRLAAMLKDQQADLAEMSSKEESLVTAALPFEDSIGLNQEQPESQNA